MATRIRKKNVGFVGVQLGLKNDNTLVDRLDRYVQKTTLNRSQVIRIALIEKLDREDRLEEVQKSHKIK